MCDSLQVVNGAEDIQVSFAIENQGDCCGKTVAQLYVKRYIAGVRPRDKELSAFQKVAVEAGERIVVSFCIEKEALKDCVTGAIPQRVLIMAGDNPMELLQEEITI